MAPLFRKLTKRFFIISNILAVLFFLIACLAAYCNPVTYWMVALFGVGFIFFTVIVLSFLIFSGLLVITAIDHQFAGAVRVRPDVLSDVLEDFSAPTRP